MQLTLVVRVKSHDTLVKMEGRGLFCAACGDLERVRNASNRRKLGSTNTSSRRIYPLWKSLLMNEMMKDCYHQYQNDVDHLLQQEFLMCIRCFYAYEKHIESLEVSYLSSTFVYSGLLSLVLFCIIYLFLYHFPDIM